MIAKLVTQHKPPKTKNTYTTTNAWTPALKAPTRKYPMTSASVNLALVTAKTVNSLVKQYDVYHAIG